MKKQPNQYMKYATMGTQMLITIGLGVFLGIKLDKWLQLKFPVFTVVLSLLSVFAAIYLAVKDLLKRK
jgi:F0F1-type ATP synthase assembly protein I